MLQISFLQKPLFLLESVVQFLLGFPTFDVGDIVGDFLDQPSLIAIEFLFLFSFIHSNSLLMLLSRFEENIITLFLLVEFLHQLLSFLSVLNLLVLVPYFTLYRLVGLFGEDFAL